MSDDDAPPGYLPLRRGISEANIIVPSTIAADINDMRLILDSRLSLPEHYRKAGLPVTMRALQNQAERDEAQKAAEEEVRNSQQGDARKGDDQKAVDATSYYKVRAPISGKPIEPDDDDDSKVVSGEAKPLEVLSDEHMFLKLSESERDKYLARRLEADPFPSAGPQGELQDVPVVEDGSKPAAIQPHELGLLVPTVNTAKAKQKYDELRLKHGSSSSSFIKANVRELAFVINRGHRRLVKLTPDLVQRLADLQARMPNFEPAIQHVLSAVELARRTGTPLTIKPMLLAGTPGVGKSHFAHELAKTLGVGSYRYDLSAAESTSVLMGSESHWGDAQPGVMQSMLASGGHGNQCSVSGQILANPVVALDEIDKAKDHNAHHRPAAALLALLEPSTSWALTDKCSALEFNGRHVVYVATANSLSPVSAPLRSRFELILVRELTPAQAVSVARRMHDDIRRALKLEGFGKPEAGVIAEVATLSNPRRMRSILESAFARAVQRAGASNNRLECTDINQHRIDSHMH